MKILYRYEISYSNVDDGTNIRLREYPVLKETKHTYWICREVVGYPTDYNKLRRRVSKSAYNTFAYDTKEKAKKHFIRRTQRRIEWFDYWKNECEKGLELIRTI